MAENIHPSTKTSAYFSQEMFWQKSAKKSLKFENNRSGNTWTLKHMNIKTHEH